jgi:CheY-like chemotaxis protein
MPTSLLQNDRLREQTLKKNKILIVDDIETNRFILNEILIYNGFLNVIEASNGEEALQKTLEHLPDIIVLDLMMPVMDGYDFLRHLRKTKGFDSLPVLVQTSLDSPEQRTKAFAAGTSDLVTKPINADELIARIRLHLERQFLLNSLNDYKEVMEAELKQAAVAQNSLMPSRKAIQALRPAGAPPSVEPVATIPPQTKAEEPEAKSRLLGGLQQAWNNLQTKAPAQSQDDPNEIVIRYRGTVVRRIKAVPVPEAELTRLATEAGVRETPPDTNEVQMRYRGSLVRRNTPESEQSVSVDNPEPEPEPTPTVATQVDVNNLLEDEDKPDDNDQRLRPRDERNNLSLRSGRV